MWKSDSNEIWNVVINIEDQYSIWPASKKIPSGWKEIKKFSTKEESLAFIKENWTDMRPRILKEMSEAVSKDRKEES